MKIAAANDPKPKNASFAQSIAQKEALVYDLRAIVNEERRYFIIKVARVRQTAFLRAVENDAGFRLEEYGDILYRGWDEPEDDLKELLWENYGMQYTRLSPEDGTLV